MRRRIVLTIAFLTTAALSLSFASLAARADVLKIVVDDTIHPLVSEHIARAIHEAEVNHDEAVLIELRTPGGLMTSMREIVTEVLKSPVPIIVYVTPSGSRAASAGFYILEAADIAVMAPGTNTGSAHPIVGDGFPMDSVLKDKIENDAAALLRSYSARRGRNVEIAESAVRQSKAFSSDEALASHLIDFIAAGESDLLRQADGRTVTRFDGSKVVLRLAGKSIRNFKLTVRDQTLNYLMDPNVSAFLLLIGIVFIFVEFNHPGLVAPGAAGFICLMLAAFALHLLPLRYGSVAMIIAAFVLFALEAKFQSHGALGLCGVVLLMTGTLLLVDGPIPEMRVKWQTAVAVSLPLGAITIFLMNIAIRARRAKVRTGPESMIGSTAVVQSPLTPQGKVFIQGETWDAIAPAGVEVGRPVVVRRVDKMVLYVEPQG